MPADVIRNYPGLYQKFAKVGKGRENFLFLEKIRNVNVPGLAVIFAPKRVMLTQALMWLGLGVVPLIVFEVGKIRWRTGSIASGTTGSLP
jgi:hypothetical protein